MQWQIRVRMTNGGTMMFGVQADDLDGVQTAVTSVLGSLPAEIVQVTQILPPRDGRN